MILTSGFEDSKKLTTRLAEKLWECDEIRTFKECGWFRACGWNEKEIGKGMDLAVSVHTKSRERFRNKMKRTCPECGPHKTSGPSYRFEDFLDRTYYNDNSEDKCEALERKVIYTP